MMEVQRTQGMWMRACELALVLQLVSPYAAECAENDSVVVGQGRFLLHKFENPIGEETYRIVRVSDTLSVGMNFKFTDRGVQVPLAASLRCAPDLTPRSFAIKGKTSRSSRIDDSVEVGPGMTRIRDRDRWSEVATTAKPPASFEPGVTKVAPELAAQLIEVDLPSRYSALMDSILTKELSILGILHRAGITIVAGTDQSVPGHSVYREIELYVQAGFSPQEALQAASIIPARVMGLEKELGTIEKGKRADLIIVNGNPLEDIHNIRNVEFVITNGSMYNSSELWRSVGFKPWP